MHLLFLVLGILVLVAGLLVLFRLLFVGKIPKYEGLASEQIQEYVKYLRRALAPGGHVDIQPAGAVGPIKLEKTRSKRNPLVLILSSGHLGREAVGNAAKLLDDEGIKYAFRRTAVRKWPHRIRIAFDADDPMTALAVCSVLSSVHKMLRPDLEERYSVQCWGPFMAGFPPEDGKALAYPRSWRTGHVLGRFVSAIVRVFR